MTELTVVVNDLEVRCGDFGDRGRLRPTCWSGAGPLVGASGSGKTTTGLALLGEYPPGSQVAGRVRVAGRNVGPGQPPRSGVVGYIPQHPSSVLNPVRRIGSVLREIADKHDRPSRAVIDSLRRAQLPADAAFLRRYPHQLSGGQQQRLVVAQALIGNPTVIVADEPTTGQDAITRTEIRSELTALTRRGIAVVMLSHDLDLVRALADQIVVLHSGQIVEAAPAEQVLSSPAQDYTRALLAAQHTTGTPSNGHTQADHPPTSGLAVTNLTARYRQGGRGFTAVHPLDLDASPGECVAIVGRSGSGKTTWPAASPDCTPPLAVRSPSTAGPCSHRCAVAPAPTSPECSTSSRTPALPSTNTAPFSPKSPAPPCGYEDKPPPRPRPRRRPCWPRSAYRRTPSGDGRKRCPAANCSGRHSPVRCWPGRRS